MILVTFAYYYQCIMNSDKINIRDLEIDEVERLLIQNGEKRFRSKQVIDWIWNKGINSFDKMLNVPDNLRCFLKKNYWIDSISVSRFQESIDGTMKILFESYDNLFFEGVLIQSKNRTTACISTQIGCPLSCLFCESGKNGFTRNLGTGEIFDQIVVLNNMCLERTGHNLSNIVIMGMGEPLLNYNNTVKLIKHICADYSYAFSPSRITISTAGIVPGIIKLADDNLKINLAISLHTANDKKRNILMPINKKYNTDQLKEAIKYYYSATGNRITYEYLIIANINDSISDAVSLSDFTKISPCKINIIEYNETPDSPYRKADNDKLLKFADYLKSKNLVVNIRKSKGGDIQAACGQLAKKTI